MSSASTLPKLALTVEEAADACGVGVDTIYAALRSGALAAKRSGRTKKGDPAGKYLVRPAALDEWLDSLPDG